LSPHPIVASPAPASTIRIPLVCLRASNMIPPPRLSTLAK
jgi:hypothetical protein